MDALEASHTDAVVACETLLRKDGLSNADRVAALKVYGRALYRSERDDEAVASFKEALRLAPDDVDLIVRRGWIAFKERDLSLAYQQAVEALKRKSDYARAYGLMGVAFSKAGPAKIALAKQAYDEAIRLDPDDPEFRYNRYLLSRDSDPAQALQELEGILSMPSSAITKRFATEYDQKWTSMRVAANLERGRILSRLGRVQEATQAYDRAIDMDPGLLTFTRRAHYNLSQMSASIVQKDLDRAFALDADFWFARQIQGKLYFYAKRYDAAEIEFARAIKGYPINGELHWWHAAILRKLGRADEAVAEGLTAFEVDPGFVFNKAGMLQKRGYLMLPAADVDPGPAFEDAARACMLDPECF